MPDAEPKTCCGACVFEGFGWHYRPCPRMTGLTDMICEKIVNFCPDCGAHLLAGGEIGPRGEVVGWKPEQRYIDHLVSAEFRDVACLKRTLKAYVDSGAIVCADWDRMLEKVVALEAELKARGEVVGEARLRWRNDGTILDLQPLPIPDDWEIGERVLLVRPAEERESDA